MANKSLYVFLAAVLLTFTFTISPNFAKGIHPDKKSVAPLSKKITKSSLIKKDPKEPDRYLIESRAYRAEFTSRGFKFTKTDRLNTKRGKPFSFSYIRESLKIGDKVLWNSKHRTEINPLVKNDKVIYGLTDNIREIYEARKGGIEQSWIIQSRPSYLSSIGSPDKASLIIEGKIATDLKTRENKKRGIDFIDSKGKYLLSYGRVTVKDKSGKTLQVLPVLSSADKDTTSIKILVSAKWLSEASYPVIIDPFIGDEFIGSEMLIGTDLIQGNQNNSSIICTDNDNEVSCFVAWEDYRNGSAEIYGGFFVFENTYYYENGDLLALPADEYPSFPHSPRYYLSPGCRWEFDNTDNNKGGSWNNTPYYFWTKGCGGELSVPISISGGENPSIAYDGTNSGYLTVWQENNGGSYDIYGRIVTPVRSCCISDGKCGESDVWTKVADVAECVGQEGEYSTKTLNYKIDKELIPTANNISIAVGSQNKINPAVAFDGTKYLVVWQEDNGNDYDIYGSFVDTLGQPVGSAFPIANSDVDETGPVLAFDGTNYLVVWERNNRLISGSFVSTDGIPETAFVIACILEEIRPSIAFDGVNYLVVWQNNDSSQNVLGKLINTSGGFEGEGVEFCIACTPEDEADPTLAFDGTNYLVIWSENSSGVYGQAVDTGGALSGAKIIIPDSTAAGAQERPQIAFDSVHSHYMATWTDSRALYDFDGTDGTDIYGQVLPVLPASGDLASIQNIINFPIENKEASAEMQSVKAASGTGRYLVTWNDLNEDLYGQFIDKSSGEFTGNNFLIDDTVRDTYGAHDIAFVDSGTQKKFLVVNKAEETSGSGFKLEGRFIDEETGVISAPPFDLYNNIVTDKCRMYVASGDNKFLIIWNDRYTTGTETETDTMNGMFVDINGAPSPEGKFEIISRTRTITESDNKLCPIEEPAFDADNNRFLVIWRNFEADGNGQGRFVYTDSHMDPPLFLVNGIRQGVAFDNVHSRYLIGYGKDGKSYIRLFNSSGIPISAEKFVSQWWAANFAFDGENFVIASELFWQNKWADSLADTYVLLVSPSGELIGTPAQEFPTNNDPAGYENTYRTFIASNKMTRNCMPRVVSSGSKNSMIIWSSAQNTGVSGSYEVFGFPFKYTDINDVGEYLDGDGILVDGDGSGIAGDNKCTGGDTSGCDDNCAGISNPDQADSDGDSIGDACDVCPDDPDINCAFFDGFNDGDDNGWTVKSGTWEVTGGEYNETSTYSSPRVSVVNNTTQDMAIEAKAKDPGTEGLRDFFIVFAYDEANGMAYWAGARIGSSPPGAWTIEEVNLNTGSSTRLAEVDENINVDTWYDLKVVINGDTVTLYADGAEKVSYTFPGGMPAGRIGLGGHNNQTQFDDFKIAIYPFSDDFNDGDDNGWTIESGSWAVENNEYSETSSSISDPAFSLINFGIADMTLEVKGNDQGDGGYQNFFVVFAYDESAGKAYWAGARLGASRWSIEEIDIYTGSYKLLAYTRETINTNIWYDLKVVVKGSTVTLYADGEEKGSYTFPGSMPVGRIGLGGVNSHAHFDDFKLIY